MLGCTPTRHQAGGRASPSHRRAGAPPRFVPLSKSMSLQATMDLDSENESPQAQLAEAYSAAMAEKDRELVGLRA